MPDQNRISELDVARTGVVSASKSATNEREWVSKLTVGGTHYQVSGFAHRSRPFGVDGDLLLALQTLFFQAGCPPENRLTVQPLTLLRMTNLSGSSKEYVRMREGLLRLASVRWEMTARWSENNMLRQRTNAAGLISDLWLDDDVGLEHEVGIQISKDSTIIVVFTATFADLIRQGLYQILDGDLLKRLGTPAARMLYGALAAHRVDGTRLSKQFTVNLHEWATTLGLNPDPKYFQRSLNLAHERLIDEGYLSHTEQAGRGLGKTITYFFAEEAQSDHVKALLDRGVGGPVAASLAAAHPDRIMPAIHAVEEKVRNGWKARSTAGAIVEAIKNPDGWNYLPQVVQAPATKSSQRKRQKPTNTVMEPLFEITLLQHISNLYKIKFLQPLSGENLRIVESLSPEGQQALKSTLEKPRQEAEKALTGIFGLKF